jgi:hypothetical protein|uniref:Transmembrane protein n=1 Tax=Globisporangium ultimum (strain ATCC 200006 / CBS 805.95 / DAOM BR144) TaxID=431595 RepID=K3WF47_GLOUD
MDKLTTIDTSSADDKVLRLPALDSVSPAAGFVSIFTPQDKSSDLDSEETDANGIRLHSWSTTELRDFDYKSGYFWAVSLCPCFAVAQLEKRMGLSRYAVALATAVATYAGFLGVFIAILVEFFSYFDDSDSSFTTMLLLLIAFIVLALVISMRVAHLRTRVRHRFLIPGSEKDDRYVGCLHTSRAIRQMGAHLKCDRAVFCASPSMLHAYEV